MYAHLSQLRRVGKRPLSLPASISVATPTSVLRDLDRRPMSTSNASKRRAVGYASEREVDRARGKREGKSLLSRDFSIWFSRVGPSHRDALEEGTVLR